MEEIELQWTQRIIDKIIIKHGVIPEEVEETIHEDKPVYRRGPGTGNNKRYYVLGQTVAGRYLFIVMGKISDRVFSIITARNMDSAERRLYHRLML